MALIVRKNRAIEITFKRLSDTEIQAVCEYLETTATGSTAMDAVVHLLKNISRNYRMFNDKTLQKKAKATITRQGRNLRKRYNKTIIDTKPPSYERFRQERIRAKQIRKMIDDTQKAAEAAANRE